MLTDMRALSFLSLVALIAACKTSTAPNTNDPLYSCTNTAYPTTAPASITVTGTVTEFASSAVAGARVDAFKNGTATSIDSATTDSLGRFSLTVATGGVPLDGYLRAAKTGYLTTYAFPSAPLPANTSLTLAVVTPGEFNILASASGVTPVAGKGSLAIRPVDCTGAAAVGGTVATSPAATAYSDGSGDFFEFNLAPGSVTVGGATQSHVFHQHAVTAFADAVTITIVAPGPLSPPQ